jgi:hypothetical protein
MSNTMIAFPHNWRELPVWALLLINQESRNWCKTFTQSEVYYDSKGMSDLVFVFTTNGYWTIDRINPDIYFVAYN